MERVHDNIVELRQTCEGGRVKKLTPEQEVNKEAGIIVERIGEWNYINKNGCNDPFWPDGCNMNLLRNHIIYAKRRITELCEENGIAIPEAFYLPTPPEVDNNYMANLKQKERVSRLKKQGNRPKRKKNVFDDTQTTLF